jgi:hypothetical protein
MDDSKKSKTAEPKTETPPETPSAHQAPAAKEPVFSLERLRRDCLKLFGVSTSTFDGAALGREGEFSVKEIREIIQMWQGTRVFPAAKKEGD